MYKKDSTRINVQYLDADTDALLFEVKDRNWMNVGELLTDNHTNILVERELKNKRKPKKIMVIAVAEFSFVEAEK